MDLVVEVFFLHNTIGIGLWCGPKDVVTRAVGSWKRLHDEKLLVDSIVWLTVLIL